MNHRSLDIFVVIACTLITIVLVFAIPASTLAGRIWTLPLVLLLPGYALTSALFVKQELGALERFIFSLGLSLPVVILGGLVLNLTPFGLRAGSWAVFLGSITMCASIMALFRRHGRRGFTAGQPIIRWPGFNVGQARLLVLAGLIVCGALVVAIIGAEQQPRPGFTQLWMLPASGANAKEAVRLGVSNRESTAMNYRLDVNINGRVVKEWSPIVLNPGEEWEVTFALPQTQFLGIKRVEADLYRINSPRTVYRQVVLWVST